LPACCQNRLALILFFLVAIFTLGFHSTIRTGNEIINSSEV
jgi:hypothetical protein